MSSDNTTTIGLLAGLATPVLGFSGLLLANLNKHANRLSLEVREKEAVIQKLNIKLTEALVQNAELKGQILSLKSEILRIQVASTGSVSACDNCELKDITEAIAERNEAKQ